MVQEMQMADIAGEEILGMSAEEVRRFRLHHASMVYQDPASALNPSLKVDPTRLKVGMRIIVP